MFLRRLALYSCFCLVAVSATSFHKGSNLSKIKLRSNKLQDPFHFRQAEGFCPDNTTCPADEFCCPGLCCEREYPNCAGGGTCVDDDGVTTCVRDGEENNPFPCTACVNGGGCGNKPYTRCAADPDADYCLTEQGYIACGEDAKPGVFCNKTDKSCCAQPLLCCPDSNKCCSKENGGIGTPEPIAPLVSFQPGATPSTPPSKSPPAESGRTPRPSPPPVPTQSQPPSCFPGQAVVEMKGGHKKSISSIQIGDEVLVSSGTYSEVFAWTHRNPRHEGANYVRIQVADGHALTATIGHIVYVCKGMRNGCAREIANIEEVEDGDGVWIVDREVERAVRVTDRRTVKSRGLFNPHTIHGDIVVDGVASTCYTRAVEPKIAHSLLAPVRAFYMVFRDLIGRVRKGKELI